MTRIAILGCGKIVLEIFVDALEAFFSCRLSKSRVHIRPFVVFA